MTESHEKKYTNMKVGNVFEEITLQTCLEKWVVDTLIIVMLIIDGQITVENAPIYLGVQLFIDEELLSSCAGSAT